MASITISDLDEGLVSRLRLRAAENCRSMEEEVIEILRAALGETREQSFGLGTALMELFQPIGGVELEIPPRGPMREPPRHD